MLKYANDGNRDVIQGVTTFFASIISICLPLISGIIIKYTGDELGYKIVFGIVAILAILAILVSFKVKKLGKKEARSNFLKVFSTVMKDRNGRKIMLANAIDNGRTFTLLFFIPVILNTLNKDPMIVSVNSVISNVVGIAAAALYGILVHKDNRVKSILIASILSIVACSTLWINYSVVTVIIFATVFTLTSGYISYPVLSTHFKVMESIEGLENSGAEVHIVREFFVTLGRLIGIGLIFLLPQTEQGAIIVIFILLSLNFISLFVIRNVQKSLKVKETPSKEEILDQQVVEDKPEADMKQ